MSDTTDGTINDMRALDPQSSLAPQVAGQIFRVRGDHMDPVTGKIINRDRIDTCVWDPTPYVGPLYDAGGTLEPLQLVGLAPDIESYRDGSGGVWKWVNPPRGFLDAARIYGLRPTSEEDAKDPAKIIDNHAQLQRCIREVLLASTDDDFPFKSWHILLPSGDLYVNGQINFNLYDAFGKIIRGGFLTFEGHGQWNTRIINYSSDPLQHAFLLGDMLGNRPTDPNFDGAANVGALTLKDLELIGTTNGPATDPFAVLRLWQGRGPIILQNMAVRQKGTGHGIDGSDVFLGSFHEVTVSKLTDEATVGYTGRGLWLHTEEHPFFVSGEFELQRISAFGPWSEGIVIGENVGLDGEDRFYGGLTAQFLNAEQCREGIVIGRGAADIDISVVWVERNERCGIRIYNGAKDVTIRRVYSWHTPGGSPIDPDYPPPTTTFKGDIILGKVTGGGFLPGGWNAYEGIEIDGVYQHFIYGPAVLLHAVPDELRRDITIRNVRAGTQRTFFRAGEQIIVLPFTDAVVKIDQGDYEGLSIERVRPYHDGGLPQIYPGTDPNLIVALIDRPELADRVVYSGPYNEQYSFGVHTEHNQVNAIRTRTHTASATLVMADPTYHRIDATSGGVTITLPDINGFGFVPDRLGVEFHLMKSSGGAANLVTIKGKSGQALVGQGTQSGQVLLLNPYDYVHVRSAKHGSARRWEVIGYYTGPNP